MDNQNNNQSNLPPGLIVPQNSQPDPAQRTPEESTGAPIYGGATVFEPPKKSGKKLAVLLVLVLLAAGGAAAWWFMLRNTNEPAATTSTVTAPATKKTALAPASLLYAEATQGIASDQCSEKSYSISSMPLSGGSASVAKTTVKGTGPSTSILYKEKSAYVLTECSGKEQETIWYSSDSGKTYEKIYTLAKAKSSDSYNDTVTSMKFADDGKSIVFAEYSAGTAGKNKVKELDLSTKKTSDILSVDGAAFVQAYARAKKVLYYYQGCYFCDGNTNSKLLKYDGSTSKSDMVFEQKGKFGIETRFSDKLDSMLYVLGEAGDGIGGGSPYTTLQYNLADATGKQVVTAQAANPQPGYTLEGLVYYVKGKGVYTLSSAGKESLVFQADQPIYAVYLVSNSQVIVSTGTEQKYTVSKYDIATKKTTKVLDGNNQTVIMGVAWK